MTIKKEIILSFNTMEGFEQELRLGAVSAVRSSSDKCI